MRAAHSNSGRIQPGGPPDSPTTTPDATLLDGVAAQAACEHRGLAVRSDERDRHQTHHLGIKPAHMHTFRPSREPELDTQRLPARA